MNPVMKVFTSGYTLIIIIIEGYVEVVEFLYLNSLIDFTLTIIENSKYIGQLFHPNIGLFNQEHFQCIVLNC